MFGISVFIWTIFTRVSIGSDCALDTRRRILWSSDFDFAKTLRSALSAALLDTFRSFFKAKKCSGTRCTLLILFAGVCGEGGTLGAGGDFGSAAGTTG